MSKKVLVLGGTGFIGSEICRVASCDGHDVVSVGRSGRPEGLTADWADQVTWVQGNALRPETWRYQLDGCDAVIHTVGIIGEDEEAGTTYERIQRDSADIASWEAEQAGVPRFVYLSAHEKPPFVSERFLSTKREAEALLRSRDIKESLLRPNVVYGPNRKASMAAAKLQQAGEKLPFVGDRFYESRPLRVEQVASAAVRAATEEGFDGVIPIDLIEYLADGHWTPNPAYNDGVAEHSSSGLGPKIAAGVLVGLAGGLAWGYAQNS